MRIDNTGSTSITITDLTVTLNPGTGPIPFTLWTAPVTLAPGQKAIYAQTAQYNFDSSDYGFLGVVGIDKSHPLGGCTNPAALTALQQHYCQVDAPTVTFNENGTAKSYIDSGTVLNTFGYDFLYGSSDGNESINWNIIGTTVNRGGSGSTPEPSTFALLGGGLLFAFAGRRIFRKS
ncbi:MAG: PEP-CTERM sorting domain-containing protein [Acidobacteriota bacterium]|nr:PEP-CTERM sorting domain-containing protein [Acidobacteriota bacterium]